MRTFTNWLGKSLPLGVRELRLQLHGAGGHVDLVVDGEEARRARAASFCSRSHASTAGLSPALQAREHARQRVLRDREEHRDRLRPA